MKRQSKLNRFVDITASVIIGLLLCVALLVILAETPIWALLIVMILDSPLYSRHGFVERALMALIHKELIPWRKAVRVTRCSSYRSSLRTSPKARPKRRGNK